MVGPAFLGDIAIENGRIREVGENLSFPDAETIELAGAAVMPGLIDAHCHIGMWEDGIGAEGDDGNEESDPITPEMRAIDAINPFDRCFEEARENGVTTVVTGPGSANVIGGTFAALKTSGNSVEEMLIKSPMALEPASPISSLLGVALYHR